MSYTLAMQELKRPLLILLGIALIGAGIWYYQANNYHGPIGVIGTETEGSIFSVGTSTPGDTFFDVDASGRVGVGTIVPEYTLDISSGHTTTVRIDSRAAGRGACLILKDQDGAGYTYVRAQSGQLIASKTPCDMP